MSLKLVVKVQTMHDDRKLESEAFGSKVIQSFIDADSLELQKTRVL